MILCFFASFMAEAMIWQMFRTVLGLRPLGCRLLSTLSILPLLSNFLQIFCNSREVSFSSGTLPIFGLIWLSMYPRQVWWGEERPLIFA